MPKIKLPTIQILKFGGQIAEFKHFYDTFNSLIINNQALDDVQKFHYLLSSVTSEAHQLIQNLPVTQQNFHVAGTLLCDRYNNERLSMFPKRGAPMERVAVYRAFFYISLKFLTQKISLNKDTFPFSQRS